MIIAKQSEIESLMTGCFENANPEIIGNEYLVIGTVERKDWVEGSKGKITSNEMIKSTYVFKDVWNFKVIPAGWYPSSDIEI